MTQELVPMTKPHHVRPTETWELTNLAPSFSCPDTPDGSNDQISNWLLRPLETSHQVFLVRTLLPKLRRLAYGVWNYHSRYQVQVLVLWVQLYSACIHVCTALCIQLRRTSTTVLPTKCNRSSVSLVEIYGFLPAIADGTPLKRRGTMKTVFVDLRRPYQILVMVPALSISNHLLRASLICLT
jgi:hypothetical protein